ncbi:MAG: LysM peptidoglycan-binding domain-containing protein [bacterium]|nr:LysM peptidoglycan-binding domain-containing protein [bacterium]
MKPNEELRTEILHGLTAAGALCGLLMGVPLLLIFGVGWPLPAGMPSGAEVLAAFKTGTISPSMILKPISVVVWLLWLQMTSGVGVELWAHLNGRVAPRVSVIPLFMQRLSARLMGTILLVALSVQQPAAALDDNQELLSPPTMELGSGQSQTVESSVESSLTNPASRINDVMAQDFLDPVPLLHTVERRDSLRALAARYLGDPNRWTEVFVLNQGQIQEDGESLTDPARLRPGWKLIMPTDAQLPTAGASAFDEMANSADAPVPETEDLAAHQDSVNGSEHFTVTVQEGDTLWDLAEHHLKDPERWVEILDHNQDVIQDPDMILPGWQLQVPAQDSKPSIVQLPIQPWPEPVDSGVLSRNVRDASDEGQPLRRVEPRQIVAPVAAFTTAKPTVVANIAAPTAEARPESQTTPSKQTMLAIGGLGVFVSSLSWVLVRLRKTQRRRLPSGRMPVALSHDAAHLDQQLQAVADSDNALFLDAALRVMSSRVGGNTPPEIIGVTHDTESASVHLRHPADAPPGFHPSNNSMTWTLRRGAGLEALLAEADDVPAPLPALAAAGTSDGRECLLNLEHMVALSLHGDPALVADFCIAIATQLASSHLADDLTVICVGFGQELTVFERVEHVPDVAAALERLQHHKRQHQALLGNHPPLVASRIGTSGDYSQPIVVLAPDRLAEEEATQVLGACVSPVCVVAHGLQGAAWSGHFDGDNLLLEPIGLRLKAHCLSGAASAAIAELAENTAGAEQLSPRWTGRQHNSDIDFPLGAEYDHRENPGIEVRVLGPVEVIGAKQPFASRRALDLVAFLAFHPEGADRDQMKAQLWPPDHPPSNSTLANTISRARKALGADDDGKPYLPRANSNGIYRLHEGIETDVDRFKALVDAARDEPGPRGQSCLRTALKLVRGTPFTGGGGDMYRWADFGLRTQIECLVDTAAHELASRCIDAGDLSGAASAAMTSLRLVGVCEQCYRWRLIAAADNPTEMRKIMAELDNLLKRESPQGGPDDLVRSNLLELSQQLMSGHKTFN